MSGRDTWRASWPWSRRVDRCTVGAATFRTDWGRRRLAGGIQFGEMPLDIKAPQPSSDRPPLACRYAIPLAHGCSVVEEVDPHIPRTLVRARRRGAPANASSTAGPTSRTRRTLDELGMGRHDRELVDILQRAAPPQQRRRRTAEHDNRRLRELRVLQRCDDVGDTGAGGHRCDPGTPVSRATASAANNAVVSSRTSTTRMPCALVPARMGEICPGDTGHAVRAPHRRDTVATVDDELVCSLLHASTRALLLRQSLIAA